MPLLSFILVGDPKLVAQLTRIATATESIAKTLADSTQTEIDPERYAALAEKLNVSSEALRAALEAVPPVSSSTPKE